MRLLPGYPGLCLSVSLTPVSMQPVPAWGLCWVVASSLSPCSQGSLRMGPVSCFYSSENPGRVRASDVCNLICFYFLFSYMGRTGLLSASYDLFLVSQPISTPNTREHQSLESAFWDITGLLTLLKQSPQVLGLWRSCPTPLCFN